MKPCSDLGTRALACYVLLGIWVARVALGNWVLGKGLTHLKLTDFESKGIKLLKKSI